MAGPDGGHSPSRVNHNAAFTSRGKQEVLQLPKMVQRCLSTCAESLCCIKSPETKYIAWYDTNGITALTAVKPSQQVCSPWS